MQGPAVCLCQGRLAKDAQSPDRLLVELQGPGSAGRGRLDLLHVLKEPPAPGCRTEIARRRHRLEALRGRGAP